MMQSSDAPQVPRIPADVTVAGEYRAEVAHVFRAAYERGATIRALVKTSGRSFGFVRKLLGESGATMRPRGGPWRRRSSTEAPDSVPVTDAAV
ncbi:helix-turn-helix domain-containing protein [Saccharopolyspora sp. NPDC000359]|uniref:helix-turn-helix domain-containing protein n=1 Tax=Saccharopolyspora sp. NPDC000359 TaxID=3154251 RepID=UPI0033193429